MKLSCKATGIPLPKYQWIYNKQILKEQTSAELCINDFTLEKTGEYQCLITQEGSDIQLYTDHIRVECSESPIQIIESPSEHLVLLEGSEMHLNVKAIADRPLKYQWFKDFLPLLNEQSNFLKVLIVYLCYNIIYAYKYMKVVISHWNLTYCRKMTTDADSFIPLTSRDWNSLQATVFTATYNLQLFKTHIHRHLQLLPSP